MAAYSSCSRPNSPRAHGYTATRHQREVGTGYFDLVREAISGGAASTAAMAGSTETAQFLERGGGREGKAGPRPLIATLSGYRSAHETSRAPSRSV
jgi:hypothetical protein